MKHIVLYIPKPGTAGNLAFFQHKFEALKAENLGGGAFRITGSTVQQLSRIFDGQLIPGDRVAIFSDIPEESVFHTAR